MDFNQLILWCIEHEIDFTVKQPIVYPLTQRMNDFPRVRFSCFKMDRHIEVTERTWERLMDRVEFELPYIFNKLRYSKINDNMSNDKLGLILTPPLIV